MIENVVNKANDLSCQDIVETVALLKIFTQDQGEQKLAQVTDTDHRQLLQKQSGRSAVISRTHNNIQEREFLFKPDKWTLRPIFKLGIAAYHCGKPCSSPEDHDARVTASQATDLLCQTRDRVFIRPSWNGPVDNRLKELVNVSADL
jgi:hypothetical protein